MGENKVLFESKNLFGPLWYSDMTEAKVVSFEFTGKIWNLIFIKHFQVVLVKNMPAKAGDARDAGLIPVVGRFLE